uniref:Ammonium_transp domain-containing protein n=1 Tax=Macrostomum lignano TaxID=282301 RepID=A0A1I8GY61_9PLAT
MDKMKIDDPVGAFPVHGLGGLWGMLACGIFVDQDPLDGMNNGQKGLLARWRLPPAGSSAAHL